MIEKPAIVLKLTSKQLRRGFRVKVDPHSKKRPKANDGIIITPNVTWEPSKTVSYMPIVVSSGVRRLKDVTVIKGESRKKKSKPPNKSKPKKKRSAASRIV